MYFEILEHILIPDTDALHDPSSFIKVHFSIRGQYANPQLYRIVQLLRQSNIDVDVFALELTLKLGASHLYKVP